MLSLASSVCVSLGCSDLGNDVVPVDALGKDYEDNQRNRALPLLIDHYRREGYKRYSWPFE